MEPMKRNIIPAARGCRLTAAMAVPALAADAVIADSSFGSEKADHLASGAASVQAAAESIDAVY